MERRVDSSGLRDLVGRWYDGPSDCNCYRHAYERSTNRDTDDHWSNCHSGEDSSGADGDDDSRSTTDGNAYKHSFDGNAYKHSSDANANGRSRASGGWLAD